MEANDRILSDEQINAILGYSGMKHEYQRRRNLGIARAQDEVSFKSGTEEVFTWGNEPCPHQFYFSTKQQCRACWDELRDRVYGKPVSRSDVKEEASA